ncbi:MULTISPECIES: RBBP9/YdeN family alpha/beta hydrolase [Variovorax]|jgi:predicted alpha/beta hydrolase family esterase|uniref:Alpha/beta hydrolase n=1 Tax=Variovorax paradoxus TaxID=34073 RepID=A0AA91IA27_VARPD|nr:MULTISPECIES: alpha/beta hydrolase [Variovorax]AVQ82845.1 alpha/beta hydrolase [Variovorax sp. PMC12]OAK60510.1 alpha/beta hydrolase [Variovorax paradoxus]QRY32871.1 alpha/beta hydrolase [Variovorax sp. PDNC026]
MTAAPRILLLPGWQNSGPGHWQTRWESVYGDHRVEQHEWMRPLRGDWSIRLEEEVLASPGPVVLAAHSLGCILVAAWASHSRNTHKVRGALLVAPGDLERDDLRQQIPGWAPIVRQPLPFPAVLIAANDDPYCEAARSRQLASDWGARFVDAGARGHLNAESGLGDWPEGRDLLNEISKEKN